MHRASVHSLGFEKRLQSAITKCVYSYWLLVARKFGGRAGRKFWVLTRDGVSVQCLCNVGWITARRNPNSMGLLQSQFQSHEEFSSDRNLIRITDLVGNLNAAKMHPVGHIRARNRDLAWMELSSAAYSLQNQGET